MSLGSGMHTTTLLPAHHPDELAGLSPDALLNLLIADEDRAPRALIDECARRGEAMVERLAAFIERDDWTNDATLGEWWLRLHAVMILGLVSTERAGLLLIACMRRIERANDEDLQDWLSGYWPALFRNKPEAVVSPLRELAQDRSVDWYMRIQAIESLVAIAERGGAEALEAELDCAARIAADESEDWTLRLSVGNTLLNFPRERHRTLLQGLAKRQRWPAVHFGAEDVQKAFSEKTDTPEWGHFGDPWVFYSAEAIAERRKRWAEEDARARSNASRIEDDDFDDLPEPLVRVSPKVGRNDPCPCGSGKKYKKCCLAKAAAEPVADLTWRRLQRLLDEHQRAMLRFFRNAYGAAAIDEAWRAFVADEAASFDAESHVQIFMPWMFHLWSPDPATTKVRDTALHGVVPTAHYLRRTRQIEPLLRAYLESCLVAPLSVFEIVHADPGEGFLLRDIFTCGEHEVTERSASSAMDEGDLVFGQIGEAGGVAILEASQGFVVPPLHKIEILALRRRLSSDESAVPPQRLRERHLEIVASYRDIARRILQPHMPKLANMDGEPLSLRRVVFDVPSAQDAFDALKHLALADSEADLLREATRDASGALVHVRFDWLKEGNARMPAWENTVLGSVEIDGTRLTAEVNSEEREERFRAIVAERLGERARYRATEIQSVERLLTEAPAREESATESKRFAELPEVRAKIDEMMAKHYDEWVTEKIPALGGRTPLEAATDADGREAVEALIAQIERDAERMAPPLDPAIPRRLRERLGLQRRA